MKRICNGFYKHRGVDIFKDEQGIIIDWAINPLDLYKTYEDAKQAINKYLDGTNTKEPRVVGVWTETTPHGERSRR